MFGIQKGINERNGLTKDLKKLAVYVAKAKGYRTINGFAADCKINADYMADVINSRISTCPTVKFLQIIADNSEGRVSLTELKTACGYSLYENNDLEQVKNIHVRRGWFCYADFGDHVMDSEYGGYRLVLIVQNDVGNKFSSTSIVLPITSRRGKSNLPTHVHVSTECGLQYDSVVSCEQVRCVSKRRLVQNGFVQKISECPQEVMVKVEIALAKAQGIIGLNVNEADAIETIMNLNNGNKFPFFKNENTYNNGYNYGARPSMVFA